MHHHTRMCTAVRSCSANTGINAGPGLAWPRCLQGTSQLRLLMFPHVRVGAPTRPSPYIAQNRIADIPIRLPVTTLAILRGGEGPSSRRSADIRKTLHPGICLKKSLQNSGLGLSAAGILKVRVDGFYKSAGKSEGSWKIITYETVT